jgi:hypothetical protein
MRTFMVGAEPIDPLAICERERSSVAPRSHHVTVEEVSHAKIKFEPASEIVNQRSVKSSTNSIVAKAT